MSCADFCSKYGKKCGAFAACSCGDCACGQVCPASQCKFTACDGKVCGDDGCGGSCGQCPSGKQCFGGACKECDDGNAVDWDGCNQGKIVEFRVNKNVSGQQVVPAVAAWIDSGPFMIVWQSGMPMEDKGTVQGKPYQANGDEFSNEFQVNPSSSHPNIMPQIAALKDGYYAIAWIVYTEDGSIDDISANICLPSTENCTSVGTVNSYVSGIQTHPWIASFVEDGGFVVVWDSELQAGGTSIRGQFVNDNGSKKLVSDFEVSSPEGQWSTKPTVATSVCDSVLVAWEGDGADGTVDILARFVDTGGNKILAPLKLSQNANVDQNAPQLAALPECRYVAAWTSFGQDGSGTGVVAAIIAANGSLDGAEFVVNSTATGSQSSPSVAAFADGSLVIAWQSCAEGNQGQDGSDCGIFAQRYNAKGWKLGMEFQVNSYVAGVQHNPAVATLKDGNFIVVWSSAEQDGSGEGFFAQRFDKDGKKIYH